MGFASAYLEKRPLFPELIREAPEKETGIIVVVPAYDEPGIVRLLDSLSDCRSVPCKVEVIIVVNAPAEASSDSLENNKLTIKNIESWKRKKINFPFRLFSFISESGAEKGWGVGMARKTGMDEALRRFNKTDNPDGVIMNLDADCLVEQNYFESVYYEFFKNKERKACSVFFEHPLSGSDFNDEIYKSIALYELHLRYYLQGLTIAGFPYLYHTIGSAMGVKAHPYVKAGGMNRRQAGEDFYFIQKLVSAGGFFNLNSTTVYPSPRTSFRVPFGTGASICKLTGTGSPQLDTYNLSAFKELGYFFGMVEKLYNCGDEEFSLIFKSLPAGLRSFIEREEFYGKIKEIRNNTSGITSFKKRFFEWFNMFRIVKYLNYVHAEIFDKKPVVAAASGLLTYTGFIFNSDDPVELVNIFRSLERDH